MRAQEFRELSEQALQALAAVSQHDWTARALGLEWTCWQTVDHVIDCLFSYAFQMAARAPSGFLPFNELHAQPTATPEDLMMGLRGVVRLLSDVLDAAPEDATASDGVYALTPHDWRARAAYELCIHTHDVTSAFDAHFRLPVALSQSLLDCHTLWMIDQESARAASDPWSGLLAGSGREHFGDG
jgi:DinB superfamily